MRLHRGIAISCAAALSLGSAATSSAKWKPHPITVIPGVPMKPEDIKPYEPPRVPPEPEPEPSEVKVIEITVPEADISMRPWSSPLVGNAADGARLPVRGVATTRRGGCAGKLWYAVEPYGWICSRQARPSDEPPSTASVLVVPEGERLPFRYVMVLVNEKAGEKLPMWATLEDLKRGAEPERQLENGDTVAIDRPYKWQDTSYWISVEGKVLPQAHTTVMKGGSEWHGIDITDDLASPFGWVTPERLEVFAEPFDPRTVGRTKPQAAMKLPRRTQVRIVEEQQLGKRRWLRVEELAPAPAPALAPAPAPAPGDGGASPPSALWVNADGVNEVRRLDRPASVPTAVTRWIDVDLGEQVLVAYDADRPVFATLVSSGRAIATPMGTYPVWAKAAAITMKNQPYEDKGYFVNKVPWSTFFQWHNAIHGAYWHDRFGVTKSHGCVNVAPLDARRIFEWVTPPLPPGWTGSRPLDLLASPTVVVRNSHMKRQFRQDRPIGPPDRELETQRVAEAEKRRADAATDVSEAAPPAPASP